MLSETLGELYPIREYESIGRLIAEAVTGLSWIRIRIDKDYLFTADQENRIRSIIARLKIREPIQYILGETEFCGLKLKVRPGVLIPRGETEELVEWILESKGPTGIRAYGHAGLRMLDIGCGSGAIAIALAKSLPDAEIAAADIAQEALSLTQENAVLNEVIISISYFDILTPTPTLTLTPSSPQAPRFRGVNSMPASPQARFDVIVSNPPYIPEAEKGAMSSHVVDYEPASALFVPDDDPLIFYRAIAEYAIEHLKPGGQVYVEIHDRLGPETESLFNPYFKKVELRKDIHGKDRMIRAYNG
ncbi:MAG: peptide chain release factor N(5)-glutamine methyltransferase [Bacteroidota bacterium]